MKENLAGLATEMVNPETQNIDRCSTLEMVELVNRQDALVAGAVAAQTAEITITSRQKMANRATG